jgi:hypothetical protein
MSSVVDVVAVRLRDARVGDWLVCCRDGRVVATIEAVDRAVLRARFTEVQHRAWNWDTPQLDANRDTLPVMHSLRSVLCDYGVRVGQVLELVRPVSDEA